MLLALAAHFDPIHALSLEIGQKWQAVLSTTLLDDEDGSDFKTDDEVLKFTVIDRTGARYRIQVSRSLTDTRIGDAVIPAPEGQTPSVVEVDVDASSCFVLPQTSFKPADSRLARLFQLAYPPATAVNGDTWSGSIEAVRPLPQLDFRYKLKSLGDTNLWDIQAVEDRGFEASGTAEISPIGLPLKVDFTVKHARIVGNPDPQDLRIAYRVVAVPRG